MRWLLAGMCIWWGVPASAADTLDYVAACKLVAGGNILGAKLASSGGMPIVYLDRLDDEWDKPSMFTCEFDGSAEPRLTKVWIAPPCDCNIAIFDDATLAAANEQLRSAGREQP